MISYIIPTRDRHEELAATLAAIDALGRHEVVGGAEVVIADNASKTPVSVPEKLSSGVAVRVLRRESNEAAAARNAAAEAAKGHWIVMLDDDSHPMDGGLLKALRDAPADTGALAAEIFLPPREGKENEVRRESGGLPEVFIGCGVAMRRDIFLTLGGYDAAFDYYAEEYDLAARMLLNGLRVVFDSRFRVMHRKVTANRDFSRIVRRLVRNNAWVAQRYAPPPQRIGELLETARRYATIAHKEKSVGGYMRGLMDLATTLRGQPRSAMDDATWDRFTGLAAARTALAAEHQRQPLGKVELIARGKNAWAVERALGELGVTITTGGAPDTLVVATMSPGPMLDGAIAAAAANPKARVVVPWVEAKKAIRNAR